MSDLIQHVIVGLAAAGAVTVIVRQVVGGLRRPSAPCDHCAVSKLAAEKERRQPRL